MECHRYSYCGKMNNVCVAFKNLNLCNRNTSRDYPTPCDYTLRDRREHSSMTPIYLIMTFGVFWACKHLIPTTLRVNIWCILDAFELFLRAWWYNHYSSCCLVLTWRCPSNCGHFTWFFIYKIVPRKLPVTIDFHTKPLPLGDLGIKGRPSLNTWVLLHST